MNDSPVHLDAAASEWTAHHEAGHAVVARVLNYPCGHATIVSDEESAGHAITQDPWDAVAHWDSAGRWRGEDSALRARIMIYMAGAEAEVEFFGECAGGDDDDRRQIAFMLDDLLPTGADPLAHEARLRRFTRALVRRHRGKIEAVAQGLLRSKHLSEGQIDALLIEGAGLETEDAR